MVRHLWGLCLVSSAQLFTLLDIGESKHKKMSLFQPWISPSVCRFSKVGWSVGVGIKSIF